MPLQAPQVDRAKLQERIRQARLTYAELGRRSGLTKGTVHDIASGRRNGTYETHEAIAKVLGVDPEDLYLNEAS